MREWLAAIKRRKAPRIALWALASFLALPLTWFLAAAILGFIPANAGREPPQDGIFIFIRSNGVHTWIMMPKTSETIDWAPYAPGAHLADPRYGEASHVAIGYGNREFYLNTPTWGDLTLSTAFAAAFGRGRTLLHVEHVHAPAADAYQRPLLLRPEEYRRLADYIKARFERGADGRTIPLPGRGYGPADMFYEANGGYSFVMTCNEWTGRALRAAGLRMGLWTPLEQSIMWRLD